MKYPKTPFEAYVTRSRQTGPEDWEEERKPVIVWSVHKKTAALISYLGSKNIEVLSNLDLLQVK